MKDIKFNLYRDEQRLAGKAHEIIEKYYQMENEREQEKKKHELFHLLVLLDLEQFNSDIYCEEIKPNEPGDAIVIDKNNNKHLIEIFRVFGDKENIVFNKKMNNIFNSTYKDSNYCEFDPKKMSKLLLDKLFDKNNKEYLRDNQYYTKNILIVTCEHDQCAICGDWIVKNVAKRLEVEFKVKNYNNVYVVDYMASGKDGGPIGFNLEQRIEEFKKYNLI